MDLYYFGHDTIIGDRAARSFVLYRYGAVLEYLASSKQIDIPGQEGLENYSFRLATTMDLAAELVRRLHQRFPAFSIDDYVPHNGPPPDAVLREIRSDIWYDARPLGKEEEDIFISMIE